MRRRTKSTARNGCATKPQEHTWICKWDLLGVLLFSLCKRGESAAGDTWATQEFTAGTRPLPFFGFGDEFGSDGIPFDVVADALEFGGVSDPVVEGLVVAQPFLPVCF
jgi:hypothetical protein